MWKKIIYALLILAVLAFFIGILTSVGKPDKKHKKILKISAVGIFLLSVIIQLIDPFIFGS